MELHTVVVNGGQLFRKFLEANDAKNSQMNSMISSQKFNPDTCDQWSFWRTCSSRSSMFFLAGGVPSFRRWILHRRSLLFLELGLAWRRACFTPQVLKLRKNAEFASIELSFCFGARGTLPPATLVAGRWTGAWICHRAPQHNLHKPGNQSGELSWTNFSRPSQSSIS